MIVLHPHLKGKLPVFGKVLVFPMDRDEVFWLGQAENRADLLPAGMAGNMDSHAAFIDHVGPELHQVVDNPAHQLFIAWDGVG